MTEKNKSTKKKLSEEEIDNRVIAQANNDSEWEEPVYVHKKTATHLSIPANLAARAAFFAHMHREPGIEEWIMRIIRERIEMEEVAFSEAKRELIANERA